MCRVDTVVLDKTGTITEGAPKVVDVLPFRGFLLDRLLYIAATLESASEHPLAKAVVNYCKEKSVEVGDINNFEALFGKGVKGVIDGKVYYGGNIRLLTECGITLSSDNSDIIREFASNGKTPILFADESQILGVIAIADTVKSSSKEAIAELKSFGSRIIMLTGDNEVTARAIQASVGVEEVIAGVLPEGKEMSIRKLQSSGSCVAMVGDGVNDSPALTVSNVGVAIGAGSDIAIESADIVLMKSNLLDVVASIKLSKAVVRNIKQNLFWAFFYNALGIPLAAGVLYPLFGLKLNPMFAAAAMSMSSIFVVSNALRLRGVKLYKRSQGEVGRKKEIMMKRVITINGMSCGHCTGRVEKVLKEIAGVSDVVMDLKSATVTLSSDISNDVMISAITNAGYEVVEIK